MGKTGNSDVSVSRGFDTTWHSQMTLAVQCQPVNQLNPGGILINERRAAAGFVIGVIESRRHRRSKQSKSSAVDQVAALPNAARYNELRLLPRQHIRPDHDRSSRPGGPKLEH